MSDHAAAIRENMMSDHVVALIVADIHLSHRAPVARSAEPDWYMAQARTLSQLANIAKSEGNVPVIIAGDLFDSWRVPAELINFAMDMLPDNTYAIPGQHDLPLHNYNDLPKSPFYTLMQAGRIKILIPYVLTQINGIDVWGFPWGSPPVPCPLVDQLTTKIAIAHSYVYKHKKNAYPGAPDHQSSSGYRGRLKGFDYAFFGDNHKLFIDSDSTGVTIVNCGALIHRKIDEQNYLPPRVWRLHASGLLAWQSIDTSEDKWLSPNNDLSNIEVSFEGIIKEIEEMGERIVDFPRELLRLALSKPRAVRKVVEEVLDES